MIYLDIDGVLAEYDYNLYSEKRVPRWDTLGAHVFRDIQRDEFMFEVVSKLHKVLGDDIYELTSVSSTTPQVRNEQIMDKLYWLSERYPMLNLCNFISCESDKRNCLTKIKGFRLTKSDILIDDYNKNLFAWKEAGGTAIKYINGINSKGMWPGICIDSTLGFSVCDGITKIIEDDVDKAVETILTAWFENTGKD